MTIKEFSNKYKVPYHLAYAASYKVKPVWTMTRDRDYDEKELYKAVHFLLEERVKKTSATLAIQQQALDNLNQYAFIKG